jgi:hypothetical protein
MGDIRVFLSHTSDLDAPLDGAASLVLSAIRTIAALPGFSVEEQTTTFAAEDQTSAEVCRRRLAGCNVYVGIIGYARGTLVDASRVGQRIPPNESRTRGRGTRNRPRSADRRHPPCLFIVVRQSSRGEQPPFTLGSGGGTDRGFSRVARSGSSPSVAAF